MAYSCGAPDDWPRCAAVTEEKKRCTRAALNEIEIPEDRRAGLCIFHHMRFALEGTTKIDHALSYAPGEKPPTRMDESQCMVTDCGGRVVGSVQVRCPLPDGSRVTLQVRLCTDHFEKIEGRSPEPVSVSAKVVEHEPCG